MADYSPRNASNIDDLNTSIRQHKRLVGKLRWLRLEQEAEQLENHLRRFADVERVRPLPIDTD